MDKIIIFIGVMVLAVLCGVFVYKVRKFFSFGQNPDSQKQEPRLPAPSKRIVANQAQIRGALISRGLREIALAQSGDDSSTHFTEIAGLERWLFARGLHTTLSPEELEMITAAPGTWEAETARQSLRSAETLGCLCWALSLVSKIPPYDETFDAPTLLSYLHIAEENFNIESATKLRTFDILLQERQRADLWRWRAELQQKIAQGQKTPRGFSYSQIIALVAKSGSEHDLPIGDDFPVFGMAFRKMNTEQLTRVTAICYMRARALDWLCGYSTQPQ